MEKISDSNVVVVMCKNPCISNNSWKTSVIAEIMKDEFSGANLSGMLTSDWVNLFIWKAFEYY